MNKRFIPLIMTIIVMIFIVCIMGVAKLSLKINKEKSVPTTSVKIELMNEVGLNVSEMKVLVNLAGLLKISDNIEGEDNRIQSIYYNYLSKYFSSSGVELSTNAADKIQELIKDSDTLNRIEKENDIDRMSFDGREVAIYILKQIYELSGLKLVINIEGYIEQIADQSGNIIYQTNNPQGQMGFQVNALIIILTIILTLFSICFIIAKRNQLFKKGVEYDGFNEKGIA